MITKKAKHHPREQSRINGRDLILCPSCRRVYAIYGRSLEFFGGATKYGHEKIECGQPDCNILTKQYA